MVFVYFAWELFMYLVYSFVNERETKGTGKGRENKKQIRQYFSTHAQYMVFPGVN